MRFWHLVGLILLLPMTRPIAQPTGLLLGVEVLQQNEYSSVWYPQTQRLRTYLIVNDASGPRVMGPWHGLIVPINGGFARVTIQRGCDRDPDSGFECVDHYSYQNRLGAVPDTPQAGQFGAVPPCSYQILSVDFASPSAVALRSHTGQNEGCEPRGFRWQEETSVQELRGSDPMRLSAVVGPAAVAAYAKAAQEAQRTNEQDMEVSCHVDTGADARWTVVRRGGTWRAGVFQQNGLGMCMLEADVALTLPARFTGGVSAWFSWPAVEKAVPDATDAVSSSAARWGVIMTETALLFASDRELDPVGVLMPIPRAKVVMALWGSDRELTRWLAALDSAR